MQECRFKQHLALAQPCRFFWHEIIPQGCHTPEFVPRQLKGAGLSSFCTSHWLTSQGHKLPSTPSSLPVLGEVAQVAQRCGGFLERGTAVSQQKQRTQKLGSEDTETVIWAWLPQSSPQGRKKINTPIHILPIHLPLDIPN